MRTKSKTPNSSTSARVGPAVGLAARKLRSLIALGGFCLAVAPPVSATGQAEDAADEEIVVTGSRQCSLTGAQLQAARRAFRNDRSRLAPASLLYFEARSDRDRPSGSSMKLELVSRDRTVRIRLDATGRFMLPDFRGDDWALVGRCHRGALAIGPLVMSPGTSAVDRRLGDLRLECEIAWAITREVLGDLSGAFVAASESCKSAGGAIYATSSRRIRAGAVTAGAVARPVALSPGGRRYRLPATDKRLPDEARVRFLFD